MSAVRVLHPITRLIIGGAQENTMLTADLLNHDPAYKGRYQVDLLCGPQTGPEGSLIAEVLDRAVPLEILPSLRREINPLADLKALFAMKAIMERGRYQIVHTHSSKAGILGRFAARLAGAPYIVHTIHGWSFHDRMSAGRRSIFVVLERLAARLADKLIVVSETDIEKGLEQRIGRPDQYQLIRSGIELDRFGHPAVASSQVRRDLGIPVDAPLVGSVTRLSPQKAPLDLIDAFALIRESHPEARYLVVGDGPMRLQVEARIRDLGMEDRVHLAGIRRDIPELMASMDLFVLSSLWEGLPRVLPQAMATGLPVVCTEADGTAEAVVQDETGIIVPRESPHLLAAGVARLLADPSLRQKLGEKGRVRSKQFGARQMVSDIDALYQALLS